MSSRRLVDPQLLAALAFLPMPEYSMATLAEVRRAADDMARQTAATGGDVITAEYWATAPDGHQIPLIVYTPAGAADDHRPAVLSLHGGGYVLGSAQLNAASDRGMASALGGVVVAVDYRLAPEAPYPIPLDDCYAALEWLHGQAGPLHIDRERIAVWGDSAGGGLAAAVSLLARDRGEFGVAHQHLIYPMLDDRTCTGEPHPHAGEFIWNRAANTFAWECYFGGEAGVEAPAYAAAARAQDLSGLPSTFIMVGALDLFVDENIAFGQRLIRAGVPTELHVFPGAYHAFDRVPRAEVGQIARRTSMTALKRALSPERR